nr:uncharacterized protein LOC128706105 [Cherax quadricarinatus]
MRLTCFLGTRLRVACVLGVLMGLIGVDDGYVLPWGKQTVGNGPVILAGLWSLKGIALIGYKLLQDYRIEKGQATYFYHPYRRRHDRALLTGLQEVEEAQKMLVSAVIDMDTEGCVLKLLCHLHNNQTDTLSAEENVLLQLFSNNAETLDSYNTTIFLEDAGVPGHPTCNKAFPRCPWGEEELRNVLQQTWGCGSFPF